MRHSSFEKPVDVSTSMSASPIPVDGDGRHNRIGAWLVAISAFVCWYQRGEPMSAISHDSSWFDVVSHAFSRGWQWGSDIIFTYGPLGFLAPNVTWNPDTATLFRSGQIVLCLLWAAMAFALAQRLGQVQKALVIVAMFALYPLLIYDIGWITPFVFAVVLIYQMVDEAPQREHRSAWYVTIIVLLSALAMMKFTRQVLWFGVIGYATALGLVRRDFRTALMFGVGGPAIFLAIWLGIGQSVGGLWAYIATSLEMSSGYGTMSLPAPPMVDAIGMAMFALVTTIIALGLWTSTHRVTYALAATALLAMAMVTWKLGYVRADLHVVNFHAAAVLIALASVCLPSDQRPRLMLARWVGTAMVFVAALTLSYGMVGAQWSLSRMGNSLTSLLHPAQSTQERADVWSELAAKSQLPRTRARLGRDKVDVLMYEQSIAFLNQLNYQPRPAFQGYAAYTTDLTRRNESWMLDPETAPDYLLMKLQSIDNRLPTGDDPSTILAALREYIPVDLEGGYLVMKRTGWPITSVPVPTASQWKVASLGADLEVDLGPEPQALFFDVQLNAWGKLRSALLREPGLAVDMKLTDGSEHSFSLVRRAGAAGMLVSPLVVDADEWLRWYAGTFDRRVVSMQLRATDQSELRWFDPVFAYAFQPVLLPRSNVAALTPELKQTLYPGFNPTPSSVVAPSEAVVDEGGAKVLFTHAPAALTFELAPGEWMAKGGFGLVSSAYDCQLSDGVALIADRVDASGIVTRVFSRQIDPVHNPAERGTLPFAFGPVTLRDGDRMILRNAVGLASDAKADCDWGFLGPVEFEKVITSTVTN